MKGIRHTKSPQGIEVLRIHYSADPAKDEKWADALKVRMSPAAFSQEMEIDPFAKSGALLYPEFTPEFTVRDPFPIPPEWTRFMAIDPHPRVPHAFLWMAVSPYEDHYYYREYWPSRAYGRRGDIPEDDEVYHIDDYVESLNLLESAKVDYFAPNGFADNSGKGETFTLRIMDTAGKAWEAQRDQGKPGTETFYDRYASLGIVCDSARKDFQAGRDIVGQRLRSRRILGGDDKEHQQSQIVIFSTLSELLLELRTARYPVLTSAQAASHDPSAQPLKKRCHMTDLLRYIEMADVHYIDRSRLTVRKHPRYRGISY